MPESVQIDALQVIWQVQRNFTRWLLTRQGPIPAIATAVERYHDGLNEIRAADGLPLIHLSEPTIQEAISYAVFCLNKKTQHVTLL